jgi:hypothetical protein
MPLIRYLTGLAWAVATIWLATNAAFACACCSDRAARYVEIEPLTESRRHEIEQMAFAKDAFIAGTAADPVIDSRDFGSELQLAVARTGKAMTFAFRDQQGRAATLTFAIPATISIFEVDPRGGTQDTGLGPLLYKEWQLTADASGTGVFRPLVGKGQKLTLILHGRGRGCTEASHFTDWTLLIQGPAGRLTLYGALTSSR